MTEREENRLNALLAKKEAEEKAEKAFTSKVKREYGLTVDLQHKIKKVVKIYGQDDATRLLAFMVEKFLKKDDIDGWKKKLHPEQYENDEDPQAEN